MVAEAALDYLEYNAVIGVGTGSTVNEFIKLLKKVKGKIDGAVASSKATAARLKAIGIPVYDLNSVLDLSLYIDSADEFNQHRYLTKGGGGALTREKIIATVAKQFICIVDETKAANVLGKFPLPVEVIPMARSYVARECLKLHADPVYRKGVMTDNGNVILDLHSLNILNPMELEYTLNNITGLVCHGLFAKRRPEKVIVATTRGVKIIESKI